MKDWKEILTNIGAILLVIFIVAGWFQPEGYWSFLGLNPYDLTDYLFNLVMSIFN